MTSTGRLGHLHWLAPWLLTGCSLALNPGLPGGDSDGGSADAGDVDAGNSTCTAHADCAAAVTGDTCVAPAACICGAAGLCEPLETGCTADKAQLMQADAVVVGSIFPTAGDFESIGLPIQQAGALALKEINEAGGLPGGRRIVEVSCDSNGSREQGLALADHLIDDVQVPVILGPAFSSIFIDVTTSRSAPKGVMTISPSATSPTITDLDDNDLGWRTAASDATQGDAIADLVRLRGYQKVIAVAKDDAYGRGLLERANTLATDLGLDNYVSRIYEDPGSGNPDFGTLVVEAMNDLPDAEVVLLLGTTEVADVLSRFETLINTSTTSNMRYIMADGGKAAETLANTMADESLITRIEGTESDHTNGDLYTAFSLRFDQTYGAAPGIYNANAYDSVYLVAYAMSTIPQSDPITGAAVAAAMARLTTPPNTVDVGPTPYNATRNALASGASFDFVGASGQLDFDDKGEAAADVARWVVEKRMSNGEFRFINVGQYPSATRVWEQVP